MITQEQLTMVAMPSMNDTHLEDVLIINRLSNAIDSKNVDEVASIFDELVEHTIAHFSGEEEMMREKMFPPYPVHKGEHDRALNELKMAAKHFHESKDLDFAKNYVEGILTPWLINHIETLDTVTAMFLSNGVSPCHS